MYCFNDLEVFDICATRANNVTGSGIENYDVSNKELAEKLHKPIIKKSKKKKVLSLFTDKIWDVGLADMQLISKFNNGIRFLLCFIDVFSK